MALTISSGSNSYTGTYNDVDILGGANSGGGVFYDTNAFGSNVGGLSDDETFLFGNLKTSTGSTTYTSGDQTSGTFKTVSTDSSGDTLVFSFHLNAGTPHTSDFLMDGAPDHAPDTDDNGAVDLYSSADINGWKSSYLDWIDSLTHSSYEGNPNDSTYNTALAQALSAAENAGWVLGDLTKVETHAINQDGTTGQQVDNDTAPIWQGDVTASQAGSQTLTADYGGNKILLGFSVGSDHIGLGGDSAVTQAMFSQYFTIASDTHVSANNVVVNDTVISLGDFHANAGTVGGDHAYGTSDGGWSVDLYGVDTASLQAAATTAGESLSAYVYNTIIAHA